MDTPDIPLARATRHRLEEHWRLRLQQSFEQYRAASAHYRKTLEETNQQMTPRPDSSYALTQARNLESHALEEFRRVLRTFTDLTLHGKMPEEDAAASSDHA